MRKSYKLIFVIIVLISTLVLGRAIQRSQIWPSTGNLQPPPEIQDPYIKQQFVNIKEWADKLQEMLDNTFRKVADIPFNQSEGLTVADTGTHDVEFSITHHLGRTPNGFIVTKTDKACSVYDSGTAWTTDTLYLKCDVNSVSLELHVF